MTGKIRGMWVYLPTMSNNDTGEEQEDMGKKSENSDVLRNLKIYLPNDMFNSPEFFQAKSSSQNKTSHMSGIWYSVKLLGIISPFWEQSLHIIFLFSLGSS